MKRRESLGDRVVRQLKRGKKNFLRLFQPKRHEHIDDFMNDVTGVIHVGANDGGERDTYAARNISVIWVEPIPEVFEALERNVSAYPNQRACRYLVTDRDGESYEFKIANNNGQSSSILDLADHRNVWPDVTFERTIQLTGISLASMIEKEGIDLDAYQGLVLDTQGTELMVLKGGGDLIDRFQYIKTEASDFEAYAGCCLLDELADYLKGHGFQEIQRSRFARGPNDERCYDVLFSRDGRRPPHRP